MEKKFFWGDRGYFSQCIDEVYQIALSKSHTDLFQKKDVSLSPASPPSQAYIPRNTNLNPLHVILFDMKKTWLNFDQIYIKKCIFWHIVMSAQYDQGKKRHFSFQHDCFIIDYESYQLRGLVVRVSALRLGGREFNPRMDEEEKYFRPSLPGIDRTCTATLMTRRL